MQTTPANQQIIPHVAISNMPVDCWQQLTVDNHANYSHTVHGYQPSKHNQAPDLCGSTVVQPPLLVLIKSVSLMSSCQPTDHNAPQQLRISLSSNSDGVSNAVRQFVEAPNLNIRLVI